MTNCTDFYTRSEGQALEARVARLEQGLELLEAAFEAHIAQDVYQGHNFNPTITIEHQFHDYVLLTNLNFDSINVNGFVDLNSLLISNFEIEHQFHDNVLLTTAKINEYQTDTFVDLNSLVISDFNIDINNLGNNSYQAELTINSLTSESFFDVEIEPIEIIEPVKSNLQIEGFYQGNYLYLTVDDGESDDTATIALDIEQNINVYETIEEMADLEPVLNKIDFCCQTLESLMSNLSNQLNTTKEYLSLENQEINNLLTVDIEGETITNFGCSIGENLEPSNTITNYTGQGLQGLHELLKTINPNIYSNFSATCNLELDTVTLVASEQEVGRIEGDVLTIHFVTLDNYPKRKKGSGKRPIHIPAPKASYNWDTDFVAIRWEQGNQFAKLVLEGYKRPISGWFKDAAAANATFDQLLTLTTATEKNRVIPIHSNPRTDIVERVSRPYRAFISREDVPGEPETLIKYFPSQDE